MDKDLDHRRNRARHTRTAIKLAAVIGIAAGVFLYLNPFIWVGWFATLAGAIVVPSLLNILVT